jgi:hypothetical protein
MLQILNNTPLTAATVVMCGGISKLLIIQHKIIATIVIYPITVVTFHKRNTISLIRTSLNERSLFRLLFLFQYRVALTITATIFFKIDVLTIVKSSFEHEQISSIYFENGEQKKLVY